MIKSGISQIGGKFRLRKELLELTPYHEFFLSLFSGSCIYELNKPRCRYECFNDKDAEFINYFLVIKDYPEEFDKLKKGVFGLVSQEICNRIVSGKLKPRNNIERAYFFYYLNKLTFGGSSSKAYCGIGNPRVLPTIHNEDIEKINANFRGVILPTVCKEKSVQEAKANYKGIIPPNEKTIRTNDCVSKATFKGINPKTTRPYSNNDCGLLTPLDPLAIKRLRYVNLTAYDFKKVYKLFYRAFYQKKGLERECLIYADPAYPGTEHYYRDLFSKEDHSNLIELMLDTPFNFMLSIGGECQQYLDILKGAGWVITPVQVRYSTNANTQDLSQEYIITNYDIEKTPKMIEDNQITLEKYMEG